MSGRDILDMLKWVVLGSDPVGVSLQKTVLRHIQCYSTHHITVSLHALHTCSWAKQKVQITWWQFVKAPVLWCMVFNEVTLPTFLFLLAVTKGSILSVSGDFPAYSSIMREICVRKRGSATCWIFEQATSCKSWQFKWCETPWLKAFTLELNSIHNQSSNSVPSGGSCDSCILLVSGGWRQGFGMEFGDLGGIMPWIPDRC